MSIIQEHIAHGEIPFNVKSNGLEW